MNDNSNNQATIRSNGYIVKVIERVLRGLENLGNKVPEPMLLFIYLSMLIIGFSYILSIINWSAVNPVTQKTVYVYNLLSTDGLIKMLTTAIDNFVRLPALGMVLTCMLGISVCNHSGLFVKGLKGIVKMSKGSDIKIITVFIFACILSHVAMGTGLVVMPPLGAIIFAAMGRNPIAGLMCAYATASGAFASNYLISGMDMINVSFTLAAAKLVIADISLTPAITYFYQLVSAIILTVASVLLTTKVLEPRLGPYKGDAAVKLEEDQEISDLDKRGLMYAAISALLCIAIICAGVLPEHGILRDLQTGSVLAPKSPMMVGLPFIISLLFFIPGTVFGFCTGSFKSFSDVAKSMGKTMADMGPYVALMFVISQFLKLFDLSNMGVILAIKGANILTAAHFPFWLVLILFVTMCSGVNVVIGSASTKWALLSTVFVPMVMFMGYHPAIIQMAYQIGDAVTNPICPTDAYFAMLLMLARKYDENVGVGTLMANMLPYAATYYVLMLIQLLVWYFFALPFGPGAPLMLGQ